MDTHIDPQATVGQLVTDRPGRSRVFETLKIDYCCGGKRPLAEACGKRGLDTQAVVELLRKADAEADHGGAGTVDPVALSLTDLADHIEREHHAYLRRELPRLDRITEKVSHVHGEADPRLAEVRRAFCALRDELTSHMMKEETILFPMIRQLEQADGLPSSRCGSIANPIRQMETEHEHAGGALATMRAATDGFQPPEWACNTYRAMLDGLAHLERDMHQHVHKENNVLFPRALELEKRHRHSIASK
jgi:regulator of cell morphogenesis and NO signaling